MVVNGRGRISGRRWVRTQGVRRILNQMVPVELVTPDCGVKLMVFAKVAVGGRLREMRPVSPGGYTLWVPKLSPRTLGAIEWCRV